jgi:signal transduction histidine kinase
MSRINPEDAPELLNDLGHLSSGIGHHVINAFSAIVSNAELLRIKLAPTSTPIDPEAIADIIIDTALAASTVARRLIDYTRPMTSIGSDKVQLDRIVADFVATRRAADPEIRWLTQIDPVPPVLGLEDHLNSMLDRLVANSIEAMEAGQGAKEISLSTSVDSRGWVMLEIRDSGRGMAPEVLEQAIEPFFSTKSGRLGVGLSIANGIWRRHRGTLSLRSQPGEGTVARLCVEPSPG